MMRRSVFVFLVIAGVMLAACGPAMVPGAAPKTETGEEFVIALPRIVLTLDANGNPGIEGLPVQDLARTFGVQLAPINPAYVNYMTQAGIQNIELRQTGGGLALLVNGKMMPHIEWRDESLNAAGQLAPLFGLSGDLVKKFTPILVRTGASVAVKFPAQSGVAEIPLAADDVALAPAQPYAGPPGLVVHFEVKYDDAGVPTIMGISAYELAAMGIPAPVALHPYYIQQLQAYNVQCIQFASLADGIHIWVNGTPLPNLVWDPTMLQNMVDVYGMANPGMPAVYLELLKQYIPMLSRGDISILVHFPVAPGQQPIQCTMQ